MSTILDQQSLLLKQLGEYLTSYFFRHGLDRWLEVNYDQRQMRFGSWSCLDEERGRTPPNASILDVADLADTVALGLVMKFMTETNTRRLFARMMTNDKLALIYRTGEGEQRRWYFAVPEDGITILVGILKATDMVRYGELHQDETSEFVPIRDVLCQFGARIKQIDKRELEGD